MSGLTTTAVRELIKLFTLALEAKERKRLAVFERLFERRFADFKSVHVELHGLFLPLDLALAELQSELSKRGNDAAGKLEALSVIIMDVASKRHGGQIDRSELYVACLDFTRQYALKSRLKPFKDREIELSKAFMGAICAYFEKGGKYEHEFGNTVAALSGLLELWRMQGPPTAEEVLAVREGLKPCLERMKIKWEAATLAFKRLEMSLQLGLEVAPELPQMPDEAALIAVRIRGAA